MAGTPPAPATPTRRTAGLDGKWWSAAELRRLAANASAPPANASAPPANASALSANSSSQLGNAGGDAGGDAGGRLSIRIEGLDESRNNV